MWHVGGKKVVHTAFWWGDVREKDHSEDLGIDGKIIILFYIHVTVHRAKFLITKPTRCNKFSNLFLEWNSTCFGQFLSPSLGVFHCTHSSGICHTGLLTYTIAVCTVKISVEITNEMQPCNRIYYSTVHWRLNMFRGAYRSSSGALAVFAASGLHTHVVTGRSQVWVETRNMLSLQWMVE